MADNLPYLETEVKIRMLEGVEAARQRIENSGYRLVQDRTLESDQLFDRGEELRSADRLLRLRRAGDRATVTYKGPGQRARHKTREEIEFDVSGAENFQRMLEKLGYVPRFCYEKYRTKFAATGEAGFITIDETPIGVFLELEGPAEWIDATASRLGLSASEYLTQSYASLYQEYRRNHPDSPANMIFGSEPPCRTSQKQS